MYRHYVVDTYIDNYTGRASTITQTLRRSTVWRGADPGARFMEGSKVKPLKRNIINFTTKLGKLGEGGGWNLGKFVDLNTRNRWNVGAVQKKVLGKKKTSSCTRPFPPRLPQNGETRPTLGPNSCRPEFQTQVSELLIGISIVLAFKTRISRTPSFAVHIQIFGLQNKKAFEIFFGVIIMSFLLFRAQRKYVVFSPEIVSMARFSFLCANQFNSCLFIPPCSWISYFCLRVFFRGGGGTAGLSALLLLLHLTPYTVRAGPTNKKSSPNKKSRLDHLFLTRKQENPTQEMELKLWLPY